MSRDDTLPPTYIAMSARKAWSDAHMYEDTGLRPGCGRCDRAWNHPNHVSRDEDKAEVRRWADRVR